MVMEATPSTPLVVSQAEVLFEVLIVPFDPPTQLGRLDQVFDRGLGWHGRKPILGRLGRIFRPFDHQPLLWPWFGSIIVSGSRSQTYGGKAGREIHVGAFAPLHGVPCVGVELLGESFHRHRLFVGAAPNQGGWSPLAAPRLRRQWPLSGRPDTERRLHPDDIGEPEGRQAGPEAAVRTIARICQDRPGRDASSLRRRDLVESDLRLGLERHLRRNLGLAAPLGILGPSLGKIQPVRDRQARDLVRHRQAHGHLAVVLLAELTAVLSSHAHRVPPLLGEPRIVDDPGPDRAVPLDDRKHVIADLGHQRLVRPGRLPDEMQQGLMLCCGSSRGRDGRHRLDALALQRHEQPRDNSLEAERPGPRDRSPRQGGRRRPRRLLHSAASRDPSHLAAIISDQRRYQHLTPCKLRLSDSVRLMVPRTTLVKPLWKRSPRHEGVGSEPKELAPHASCRR